MTNSGPKGCIAIIARLGSKRLKDKHLMEIKGQPIISYLIQRIKKEFSVEVNKNHLEIFILTGELKNNQRLLNVAVKYDISAYCGHDTNIPMRMYELLSNKKLDFIISVDGDDILCAPEGMRQIYDSILSNFKYVKTTDYPFGMNSMGMSKEFLSHSLKNQKNRSLETGWGWIFDENICERVSGGFNKDERLRFTLDYIEDFFFFNNIIISGFDITNTKTKFIINYVTQNNLFNNNMQITKKYWANFNKQLAEEIKGVNRG
jgi:spore coat polysaccharide biosynthesis protein SpsF